jgi:hypothetical protein
MMQFTPGNVKLYKAELTNSNGAALDITPQIKSLSIFESVYDPTVFCELLMEDGVDLWRNFPVIGEENLEVSFKTPSVDDITTYYFRIFKLKDKIDRTNNKTSTYVIQGVSVESIQAMTVGKLNLSFEEPFENIITNILTKQIGSSKKLFAEKTKGIVPVAIPNLYPFQAIDFLKERAVSADVPNSSYKFYENQHGFHFRTLESLLLTKRDDIGSKEFTYDSSSTSSDPNVKANSFRNIVVLNKDNLADSIKNVVGGAYKNVTETFDMITKQISKTEVDFAKTQNQFISSDRASTAFNTPEFFANLNTTVKKAKTFFNVGDSSQTTNPLAANIGRKNAYQTMFGTVSISVLVYGDSTLTVGETLKLNTTNTKGTTDRQTSESKISGTYLITALRHMISPGGQTTHYTAMKLEKMGYSA